MNRIALVLSLILASFVLIGCGDKHNHSHEKAHASGKVDKHDHGEEAQLKLSAEEIENAGIQIASVAEEVIAEQLTLTATILANQDKLVHISPRIPGRIVRVQANLGDRVKAGQELARLDSIEVGEAHSAFLQAQSHHALARADFERVEKLHKEEIIPQKEFFRARSELEKARANLRTASDKLRILGVAPTQSEATASTFPLTSPLNGNVIDKKAVLGELAQPDKPLFSIADLSTVWIDANLYEKDLGKMKVGSAATITVAAYSSETFKGKLIYISSMLDKETRTLKARIAVPNPDGRLKPEMFATTLIDTQTKGKAIVLPNDAVVLIDGEKVVFVENKGEFEKRIVDLGESTGGKQRVLLGLEPGERVVVKGAYALKARMLKSRLGEGHAH